ncbi:hypothetical protein NPIL_322221 [Nephila pilipes]|uniref:Uncharacterized protein n=1 Tax=Nephila pilipes TaxID=299642 RepID=A0A8X6T4B5_NEPPI|nr:hypothetical protein NPIL_322221 [Nephila pilipes]
MPHLLNASHPDDSTRINPSTNISRSKDNSSLERIALPTTVLVAEGRERHLSDTSQEIPYQHPNRKRRQTLKSVANGTGLAGYVLLFPYTTNLSLVLVHWLQMDQQANHCHSLKQKRIDTEAYHVE